jgi:hypothetical protein
MHQLLDPAGRDRRVLGVDLPRGSEELDVGEEGARRGRQFVRDGLQVRRDAAQGVRLVGDALFYTR